LALIFVFLRFEQMNFMFFGYFTIPFHKDGKGGTSARTEKISKEVLQKAPSSVIIIIQA
jgi:hypothetical protein